MTFRMTRLLSAAAVLFIMTATQASPVWTFDPLTLTRVSILPGDTASSHTRSLTSQKEIIHW